MSKNKKTISKKVRFEVFKRDKFICQYCGKGSPSTVLEVDHIEPKSKGGSNSILNLITSCFDCNRGKSDIKISDESAINKQKQQLDLLQERREQISLMFEWQEGLKYIDNDLINMVSGYISSNIGDFIVSESGLATIKNLVRKFDLADILESVDISASKYLKYDENGLTKDSVEEFFSKIGGILFNKNRPGIEQKMSYIKGICRNRFNYWDSRKGSIILKNYVNALKEKGWNEEKITHDLENEVCERTKECSNWSEWKNLIEGWTESIYNWGDSGNDCQENEERAEISEDDLKRYGEELFKSRKIIEAFLEFASGEIVYSHEKSAKEVAESIMDSFLESIIEFKLFDKEKYDNHIRDYGGRIVDGLIEGILRDNDFSGDYCKQSLYCALDGLVERGCPFFLERCWAKYGYINEEYLNRIISYYKVLSNSPILDE